ncbi:MAG: poly-gamma-glutamate hydrolase family protein [Acidobacteria bacterium]|nr:poly-gamma-glutamate hydrolase family protein [Acidobacteriota bacterium]
MKITVSVQKDSISRTLNSGPAHGEHCTVDPMTLDELNCAGSGLQRQLRVVSGAHVFALYTVTQPHTGKAHIVRIGPDGLKRLGIRDPNGRESFLDTRVTNTSLSEAKAQEASELIERVSGTGCDLAVLAPHGGDIEKHTDKQAKRVQQALRDKAVRCWRCMGWKAGGGASARWHITSTEISEYSFPLLGELFAQRYTHAVAFHGWTENFIGVGGGADIGLKTQIVKAIKTALDAAGSTIKVRLERSGGLSGGSPKNIVNRITMSGMNGIQIEQSKPARESHWNIIADAVADVYRKLLP